ncbi:MAG: class I SAM-dependent methyltransferase [Verrucomicrobia bacterium]|nr:class I SAM-dependent methyltransferase [Verrucomicrobiota bacterium]
MTTSFDLDALHYKKNSKSQYSQAYSLLKDIQISPEASILDIGCGHGYIIGELSKYAPFGRSVGIDPSPNMISLASEMFPKNEFSNLEFHQLKAEEMNFDPESFDLILCTNAFMWIRDPRKTLRLISKFLKPNGHFILFSYSKETPYVQLFEEVLEKNFPELIKSSAVNTMLSTDQHAKILTRNHMVLNVFKIEDVNFEYESEIDFKNYVLGWLSCYAPLDSHQQEIFLSKLIEESKKFRKEPYSSRIEIPHKTISIIAAKKSSGL